jgi:hypothetical protein
MRPAVRRALMAATAAGLWTVVGCTATVTPPRNVARPATVHLLREAMHTGLVLPPATDGAGFVEFGYGEWEWFARGNDAWYRVFPTVLWPTMGTLGARPFAAADAAGLQRAAWWAELTPLVVEASKVDALRARLEGAMRARRRSDAAAGPRLDLRARRDLLLVPQHVRRRRRRLVRGTRLHRQLGADLHRARGPGLTGYAGATAVGRRRPIACATSPVSRRASPAFPRGGVMHPRSRRSGLAARLARGRPPRCGGDPAT